MNTGRHFFTALAAVVSIASVATGQVDYATQIQPIFNANCITCHGTALSGVTLASYQSVMASTGVQYGTKIVQPGSSLTSPIYDKVSSTTPQHGLRMPRGGTPLSSAQITLIKNWIDEGAKEKPSSTSVVERVSASMPKSFSLTQNYPNPFNPSTRIGFALASRRMVTLKIYDVIGREIAVLVNGQLDAGVYRAEWNASGVPSGIYFYQLQALDAAESGKNTYVETKKLVVQK